MSWLYLAIIPQICWSISNIFDQVITRKFSAVSARGYFIIAGLSYIPFLFAFMLCVPGLFEVSVSTSVELFVIGFLNPAFVWFYIKALQQDNASMVVPIFQTVPIFVFILGFFFLGEIIPLNSIIGGIIIMAAAIMIIWDFQKVQFQWHTLLLMLTASLLFSVLSICLRAYEHIDWPIIVFWQILAWIMVGLVSILFDRKQAIEVFQKSVETKGEPYIYSVAQTATDIIAISSFTAALSIAPAAVLVTLIGGVQPIIIILFAALAYYIWPDTFDKPRKDKTMIVKVFCAVLMFSGLYLITS